MTKTRELISPCPSLVLSFVDIFSETFCLLVGEEGQAGDAAVGLEGVEKLVGGLVDHLVVELLLSML
jgi:hypothetical protein